MNLRKHLKRSGLGKSIFCGVVIAVCMSATAYGQLRIDAIWGYVKFIDIQNDGSSPINLSDYRIATSDLNQPNQLTAVGALSGITLPALGHLVLIDHTSSFPACAAVGSPNCTTVDPDTLGLATPLPFGSVAAGPYSLGLYKSGALEAFMQIKLNGTSAAGFTSNAVAAAVASGLWTNTGAFIEYQGQFAGYERNTANPTGPASYTGFVIPEPSTAFLLINASAVWCVVFSRRRAVNPR